MLSISRERSKTSSLVFNSRLIQFCTVFNILQLSILKDQLLMVVSHFFISVWIKRTRLERTAQSVTQTVSQNQGLRNTNITSNSRRGVESKLIGHMWCLGRKQYWQIQLCGRNMVLRISKLA